MRGSGGGAGLDGGGVGLDGGGVGLDGGGVGLDGGDVGLDGGDAGAGGGVVAATTFTGALQAGQTTVFPTFFSSVERTFLQCVHWNRSAIVLPIQNRPAAVPDLG